MTRSLTFNHRECRPHELADLRSLAVSSCKKESRTAGFESRGAQHSTARCHALTIYGLLVLVPLPALAVTEQ